MVMLVLVYCGHSNVAFGPSVWASTWVSVPLGGHATRTSNQHVTYCLEFVDSLEIGRPDLTRLQAKNTPMGCMLGNRGVSDYCLASSARGRILCGPHHWGAMEIHTFIGNIQK